MVAQDTAELIAALRERARRHGVTLAEELEAILRADGEERQPTARPPIRLTTVRVGDGSAWSRAEIYGDEGR